MEDVISTEWQLLYANNPKIQYFGVISSGEVVWQTNNWNLVKDVDQIITALRVLDSEISIDKVRYTRIQSRSDYFLGISEKSHEHVIICRVDDKSWVIARSSSDSVPELARIDVARTAIKLIGVLSK